MGIFSDLIARGRVRDREELRRVYRRVVKRLHPDSASPGVGLRRGFVDFDRLRQELAEAERLLEELAADTASDGRAAASGGGRASGRGDPPGSTGPHPSPRPATRPGPGPDAAGTRRNPPATPGAAASLRATPRGELRPGVPPFPVPVPLDEARLLAELRDLVARGFPVNLRAAARNKAYRNCVATVTAQLSLLTDDPDRFARIDAQMGAVKYGSLRLHYYVMQVLWNGLDWRLYGYELSRDTALRDFGVIRENLADLGLTELEALLAWIVEAGRPPSRGGRAPSPAR